MKDLIKGLAKKILVLYVKLFPIKINNYWLYMSPNNVELIIPIFNHKYEIYKTEFLKKFIKKDWVICDIGAYIGYHTTLFSKLVGKEGKVIAIEPEPEHLKILKKNIKLNKLSNVKVHNLGVSNNKGTATIYRPDINSPDSRLFELPGENRHKTKIKTDTIDNLLVNESDINLIKIDIQGWEERALSGAKKILQKHRNISLITEFQPDALIKAGTNPSKYLMMIQKLGFKIYLIDEQKKVLKIEKSLNNLIKETEKVDGGFVDLLCVRKPISSLLRKY